MTPHAGFWTAFAVGFVAGGLTGPIVLLAIAGWITKRRKKGYELP